MRRELGLGDDDVAVVLLAMLRPEKRADRFVDAVAIAHASNPRIRGLVVGAGHNSTPSELERARARPA